MRIIQALFNILGFCIPVYILFAASVILAAPGLHINHQTLKIMTFGANIQEAQNLAFFQPFHTFYPQYKIQPAIWDGTLATLQSMIIRGDNNADLIISDSTTLSIACRQGLILPLPQNIAKVPVNNEGAYTSCMQPALPIHFGVSWNHNRFNTQQNWKDFWNVSRNPGRRGLYKGVRGTLEIALLADNVSPQDVYSVLSTPEGVNRAFRKLSQIKPYISWWSTFTEAINLLQNNQVLMIAIPAEEIQSFNANSSVKFDFNLSESLVTELEWAIPAPYNGPINPLAGNFLAFMKETKPNNVFNKLYSINKEHGFEKSEVSKKKPQHTSSPPLLVEQSALQISTKFWEAHFAYLNRRFIMWLASP